MDFKVGPGGPRSQFPIVKGADHPASQGASFAEAMKAAATQRRDHTAAAGALCAATDAGEIDFTALSPEEVFEKAFEDGENPDLKILDGYLEWMIENE